MTKDPPLKGIYCLIIDLNQESIITVGKKGKISFENGCYVYVGSALNSLEARIKRHLSSEKKMHWHVDYLLKHQNTKIVDVIFAVTSDGLECQLAFEVSKRGVGIQDFGSSDCKCSSHLFYFEECVTAKESCIRALELLELKVKNLKELNI
ncbi:MAG TPA: GIY-YIG nuclease family protein [Methanobacteriaceae archaeon]|nr:GIY-YIG nuclease family protein [Methanobacteriaceae archaeon]